jgi:putative alpha-1,2-mannosidase
MDEESRKTIISDSPYQVDNQRKTGALLQFNSSDTSSAQSSSSEQTTLNVKIGISFISELKARQNVKEQIPHWDFDQTRQACIDKWEALLSKI